MAVPASLLDKLPLDPERPAAERLDRTPLEVAQPPAIRLAPEPSSTRRLELSPYDLAAALALRTELGVSHVLAQVLVRRGVRDAASVRELLEPRERHDPLGIDGMERAVDTIRRHVREGSRIVVHGDYDVDGVCATAVLVRALRSLGADARWFIPSRRDDGYGLSAGTVRRLAAIGNALLITVDCGITAVSEVAAARAAGLQVIVTDHHAARADGHLPDCDIVHPGLGGYPAPALCGTGVAHKLAEALDASSAADDLELVALATIADLVPLRGENRRLVRDGLAQLAGTAKPGLRALLEVAAVDPSGLDTASVAFRLAPRLNAAGRMRRADAALELLLTDDPRRAAEIAAELDHVNAERRGVEERIGWEAEALADRMGDRSIYVLAGAGWHPGVIGIVASRVAEHRHRPAILIALDGDGPGQGSGRSVPGFDLLAALHCGGEYMLRYGGHRAAAGLSVMPDRIDDLRAAVERHADVALTAELREPVERVDAVVSGPELSLGLAEELLRLEPFGIDNPPVNLLVTGARFDSVRPLGDGRHARFSVRSGGARAPAISFGCDGVVPCSDGLVPVDASFRLERNIWRGVVEPRLILRQATPCAPRPIEVLGEPEDYLAAVFAELDAPVEEHDGHGDRPEVPGGLAPGDGGPSVEPHRLAPMRTILDRRGQSPLAVLADACAAGGGVLGVCAEVTRRLPGLAPRAGGFALAGHDALARDPGLAGAYRQIVVLDPPASAAADAALRRGRGYTHLSWGPAELRFAQQMHELDYRLRGSLVALYRSLRERGTVTGRELERLLREDAIDPTHPRPARLAGRLLRVLAELELITLDRRRPALGLAGAAPTQLERSAAYRAYMRRYEDGLRLLSRAQPSRRS